MLRIKLKLGCSSQWLWAKMVLSQGLKRPVPGEQEMKTAMEMKPKKKYTML